MPTRTVKSGFLSNNALKIIAAALMVCDHTGMLIFPEMTVLRDIGRLAFPIFAYLIAEGAKHTKSRIRYFLTMAGFAAVIQVGNFILRRNLEMSVMVTFTLSLTIIFALDFFKATLFSKSASFGKIAFTAALVLSAVLLAAILDRTLDLDYHFSGCLLPVFPSLLTTPRVEHPPEIFRRLDAKLPRILAAAFGILLLSLDFGGSQFYAFLSLPLLLLYSEQRGKLRMKYFFYVFYPLHLILLYGIAMLLNFHGIG